jgi:hypothetical protein
VLDFSAADQPNLMHVTAAMKFPFLLLLVVDPKSLYEITGIDVILDDNGHAGA